MSLTSRVYSYSDSQLWEALSRQMHAETYTRILTQLAQADCELIKYAILAEVLGEASDRSK